MAVAIFATGSLCAAQADSGDDALAAARRFVEASDNYLHHSRLSAGMKGYGLTVMSGTKPVRFDAEIISVMTNWGPHQDVILARLSGLGLEKSMVVQGMSGSPVYVRLAGENRDRLIGAVAFGWRGQNDPICGIQPITQMLAIRGVLPGSAPPATQPSVHSAAGAGPVSASREYLDVVLNGEKLDFAGMDLSARPWAARGRMAAATNTELAPLITPLMMSGSSLRTVRTLSGYLAPSGIMPLQSGGAAPGSLAEAQAPLVPGSAVSIPLVTGDAEWAAIGTVTDVIGPKVLAFGHPFYGWGDMALPMGGASVHTIISSRTMSFKLASPLAPTGSLLRDEAVGVAGEVGPAAKKVSMIPMTVELTWKGDQRKQIYRYNVCRHRLLTAMLVSTLVRDAAWGWRSLPPLHTVRHIVEVDFGEFGLYRAEDVSSDRDVMWAASDVSRPIAAMLNNPLGPPLTIKSISVKIFIEPATRMAKILRLKLDGKVYRPGETITGKLTVRRFRKPRETMPIRLTLPHDLKDGRYELTTCDALTALKQYKVEKPQLFQPRTTSELFDSIKRVVSLNNSMLYLRLPLGRGGLALGRGELPDLPESRADMITAAKKLDTKSFSNTLQRSVQMPYVVSGSAKASFTVSAKPKETPMHK